jgi:hypothetical protein
VTQTGDIAFLSALAALTLGTLTLWYPLRFYRDADAEWALVSKLRRYGGQPSLRTPEWEQVRKVQHWALIALGAACWLGGGYLLVGWFAHRSKVGSEQAEFDAFDVTDCSLDRLTIVSRASSARWVDVGPLRAMNQAIASSKWEGRPAAISLDALGAGVLPSQVDVTARSQSSFLLAPGEARAIDLSAGAGECARWAADKVARDCKHLVFRFRTAAAEGASHDLDVLRFCELR